MNNKMEEVARMFGKELEEEFEIEDWNGFCRFTEKGIVILGERISTHVLHGLLTGELKIKWKPENREMCYSIFSHHEKPVLMRYHTSSDQNVLMLKRGLITKTEEEAIQKMKEWGWWE